MASLVASLGMPMPLTRKTMRHTPPSSPLPLLLVVLLMGPSALSHLGMMLASSGKYTPSMN